jgi:hypothetical protein
MALLMSRGWGYAFARPTTPNTTNAPLGLAPGATVTVFVSGTTTKVTLYADQAGITPLANPLTADINGYFDFYCINERIDVQFSGTGITTPYTLGDFWLFDQSFIYYNVQDYGAWGDGIHDDTAAMQAAINAASAAGGGVVWIPAGAFLFSSTLTITTSGVCIKGAGLLYTNLVIKNATQTGIAIAATNAVELSDFQMTCAVTHTGGSGVTVIGAGGTVMAAFCRFERLYFQSLYDALTCNAMAYSSIIDCYFNFCSNIGLTIQNTITADAGDNTVYGSYFFSCNINLFYESSGGLRISNNKFLGGGYGLLMAMTAAVATGDLLIEGNSFEGMSAGTIVLESNGSPAGTFVNVVIVGNQLGGQSSIATVGGVIVLGTGVNPGWLDNITVTDNVLTLAVNGQIGIEANEGSNNGTIDGNVISTAGGLCYGILINVGATNFTVGPNNMYYGTFLAFVGNASASSRIEPYVYNYHGTWNPGTIGAGAIVTTTASVLNATLGDPVAAGLSTIAGSAVILFASVSSAGVVTVSAYNPTGSPITPGSGGLNITLFHQLTNVGI